MLELECPAVTPETILKTSGHVERFTDFMVMDTETRDCFRADHLVEAAIEAALADRDNPLSPDAVADAKNDLTMVEGLGATELGTLLAKYKVVAPDTGNPLSAPYAFNLMFKTSIGPRGDLTGYLRPETAQGIFVNFRDLLYYNGNKLPFAAAQIGASFRNEISPRAGLLRVREFTQAEIEHFCDPEDKSHPRFVEVADLTPLLYTRDLQMGPTKKPAALRLGDAVAQGLIANETLGYFIGRTYMFFQAAGLDMNKVRFRQHLAHEMAHYSTDCWDGEVETSYGWVECCGIADRSAYDLSKHSEASKTDLTAYVPFDRPVVKEALTCIPDRKSIGKEFKGDAKVVHALLENFSEDEAAALQVGLESDAKSAKVTSAETGQEFTITPEMVTVKMTTKKVTGRTFIPSVVEPSFGIGRILYAAFEHAFYVRDEGKGGGGGASGESSGMGGESRTVFRFSPVIAPIKTTVFPLMAKPLFMDKAKEVASILRKAGISNMVDTTGASIGKRYARTDEIGVPFAITTDHTTAEDNTVTLRERDTMSQIRVPISDLVEVLNSLCSLAAKWDDVAPKYPAVDASTN